MAENMLESTRPKMTCRLPTLAPMFEDDCVELVWENGQLLMRGRSGRAQKVYSLSSSNAEAEIGENMHKKKARLETICTTLNDSTAFLGLLGHRDSDLNSPDNNSSSQTGYYLESSPQLYKPSLEDNRGKTDEKKSLPREHSEAFGNQTSILSEKTRKEKTDVKILTKPPVTCSSVCSLGASNDPTYSLRRTYEETESSACPSENVEEPQGLREQAPGRSCIGGKRCRTAEVHNLSERRRRDKINKKMRVLKELIPNCNKVDKASMLDEAIEYLKTLQFQLQIMSMGNGFCMYPMMLPTAMQRMNAAHFSAIGVGMGMRMGMGMGMGCSPAQFSSNIQMPGIHGQAFPMPVSHPFFNIPSLGSQPIQSSVVAHGISGASPVVEHLGSVPLTGSEDFSHNIYSEKINLGNTESSKIQTSRCEH